VRSSCRSAWCFEEPQLAITGAIAGIDAPEVSFRSLLLSASLAWEPGAGTSTLTVAGTE
jgi:hypothetical protein